MNPLPPPPCFQVGELQQRCMDLESGRISKKGEAMSVAAMRMAVSGTCTPMYKNHFTMQG